MTSEPAYPPKHASTLQKLRLLLWKNFLLLKRHPIQTVVDIFLPVLFVGGLVWLQLKVAYKYPEEAYSSESIDYLRNYGARGLAFTPNSTIFESVVNEMSKVLKFGDAIGVPNEGRLQDIIVEKDLIAGIVFNHPNDTNELPKKLTYSLRFPADLRVRFKNWQTNLLFPDNLYVNRFRSNSYIEEGFLSIQNAITSAFIRINEKEHRTIEMQPFPRPSETVTVFDILDITIILIFLLSLNYTFVNNVRYIVLEKEKQLKEAMKIMGLASWMHYFSWFIRTIIILMISMLVISILFTKWGAESAIFANSNFLCLFIFLIGYCICLITCGFVISTIFSRSKPAMTTSILIYHITSVPFFLTLPTYDNVSDWLKVLYCFCPNTALAYGFKLISRLEKLGIGLNWHTAFQTISVYDNLTVAWIFFIMLFEACILFILTLYLENVLPSGYGVTKPWYFIFTKEFWQSSEKYKHVDDHHSMNEHSNPVQSHTNFESEPTNRQIGIKIQNLTKKFTSDKAAVNQLNLNIYNGQITTLLGQNGAGKTTTISMLTGMMKITSGTALINGYDIRSNMDSARLSMGYCPQHNILFDELTVREHILFYCCLKGMSSQLAELEAHKYLQLLGLNGKENAMSSTLSGGMKRKLSVVIALCGKSKVVFLDEPTSGMDPGARRDLWDILLAEKKDRTILLTTHFMDEADILSDRIAIMADGELRCAGSTFFLKKRYGTGYHLICSKYGNCDSRQITELLQKYIPDIRVDTENDSELSYILPEERNGMFPNILRDLETNLECLNLSGLGVSLTTLEEIFLKIGKSEQLNPINSSNVKNLTIDKVNQSNETRITLNNNDYVLQGVSLLINQVNAMLKKRFLYWLRSLLSFTYYNIFVILFLSLIIFSIGDLFISKSENLPSLDITLDKYRSPFVVLQPDTASDLNFSTKFESNIKKTSATLQITNGNMTAFLLDTAKTSPREYRVQYLTGASVANGTIYAWFNNQALHSSTLALNLIHNALIQSLLGDDYSIEVSNMPLNNRPRSDTPLRYTDAASLSYGIVSAMSVLSTSYILFYIKEKQCNARFLQYASGINVFVFWGASIVWDLLTNIITICIIITMLALSQSVQWRMSCELPVVFLILFLFNVAMMPVVCISSLIFTSPSFGMNVMIIFNFIIIILNGMSKMLSDVMSDIVEKLVSKHPIAALFNSLYLMDYPGSNGNCPIATVIFSWNKGILKNLLVMLCTGVITYLVLIIIEYGVLKTIKQLIFQHIKRTYPSNAPEVDDEDVQAEKDSINKMTPEDLKSETLAMQNVSKFYGRFCAVNKFSISIKRGECFGLLGKNGAGKSSIFKMLTGETMITEGDIFTQGFNQKYQLNDIYKIIGYCPQFDALLPDLTCRETLNIFALIRGIPRQNVKNYVENCAKNLDFFQHIDKKIKQLSGGNKRKLSTSLAMMGNSSVILLDEPTTGMDPVTKRNLWNVVNQSRDSGKSIVLTSHSIEECEALCTRLTVFVNGQSKCLGSAQQLKSKFCKGFELKVKIKHDNEMYEMNVTDAKNLILQTFVGAIFREEHQGVLTYSVPIENMKWSTVFDIMENAKTTMKIEDYSINQNSLEQVVLMFVKDQKT